MAVDVVCVDKKDNAMIVPTLNATITSIIAMPRRRATGRVEAEGRDGIAANIMAKW
jgi:hypothetical protein